MLHIPECPLTNGIAYISNRFRSALCRSPGRVEGPYNLPNIADVDHLSDLY